jgi:ribosomal protein S18 acetylase RimI-like enzyme
LAAGRPRPARDALKGPFSCRIRDHRQEAPQVERNSNWVQTIIEGGKDVTKPANPALEVRPADLFRAEDAQSVTALLDSYARDPMGAGQALAEDVKERLVPSLQGVPGHLVLLAFDGDRAVGLAICFQGFSTFQARPLLNIHDLSVLTAYRRRGVATALLAAIETEARRRGCCKLTLEVREDNPDAASLYARLDFGAGRAGDRAVPYRFMEKRLGRLDDLSVGE